MSLDCVKIFVDLGVCVSVCVCTVRVCKHVVAIRWCESRSGESTCACVYVRTYVCTRKKRTYVCTRKKRYLNTCTYVHTRVLKYVHTQMHVRLHISDVYSHTLIHTEIHMYMHTNSTVQDIQSIDRSIRG